MSWTMENVQQAKSGYLSLGGKEGIYISGKPFRSYNMYKWRFPLSKVTQFMQLCKLYSCN